jgi:hypothetical protein
VLFGPPRQQLHKREKREKRKSIQICVKDDAGTIAEPGVGVGAVAGSGYGSF